MAALLRTPGANRSFGIFGRWGAGKSSACEAIQRAMGEIAREHVSRLSADADQYIANYLVVHVTIDAFRLRRPGLGAVSEPAAGAGRSRRERCCTREAHGSSGMAALTRFILPIVLAGVAGPAGHGIGYLGGLAGGALFEPARASIEKGLEKVVDDTLRDYAKRFGTNDKEAPPRTDEAAAAKVLGKAVIFVDDLDRCDPAEAFRVLSVVAQLQARLTDALQGSPSKFVRFVYSLDPEVMAQHFSKIFGVSESAGMEAMLKYIQAPFTLPPATGNRHATTLRQAAFGQTDACSLEDNVRKLEDDIRKRNLVNRSVQAIEGAVRSDDDASRTALNSAATVAAGFLPTRVVLTAVPQADLWTSRWSSVNSEACPPKAVNALFFLAVASVLMPEVYRAMLRDHGALMNIIKRLFGSVLGENVGALRRHFGSPTVDALRARPDIADLGRKLFSDWEEVESKTAGDVAAIAAAYGGSSKGRPVLTPVRLSRDAPVDGDVQLPSPGGW